MANSNRDENNSRVIDVGEITKEVIARKPDGEEIIIPVTVLPIGKLMDLQKLQAQIKSGSLTEENVLSVVQELWEMLTEIPFSTLDEFPAEDAVKIIMGMAEESVGGVKKNLPEAPANRAARRKKATKKTAARRKKK